MAGTLYSSFSTRFSRRYFVCLCPFVYLMNGKKYFCNVSCGNADTFVLGLTDRQKISYNSVNTTARKNDCHELWTTFPTFVSYFVVSMNNVHYLTQTLYLHISCFQIHIVFKAKIYFERLLIFCRKMFIFVLVVKMFAIKINLVCSKLNKLPYLFEQRHLVPRQNFEG